MIHIVVYDLRGPAGSYPEFFETLKAQGNSWWHYLRSAWLISTDKTPQAVFEALRPHVKSGDRFLVWEVSDSRQGLLPRRAWDWIKAHQ